MTTQKNKPALGSTAGQSACLGGSLLGSRPLVSAALLLLLLPLLVFQGAPAIAGDPQAAESEERPAWLRPIPSDSEPGTQSGSEPTGNSSTDYKAGWSKLEPGVLDVQAWDWLHQDLDRMLELITGHASNRLSPEAFKAKYIGATTEFLEIDGEASKTFNAAVDRALDEIEGGRAGMLERNSNADPGLDESAAMLASRASWKEYGKVQEDAVRYPAAELKELPRHELLREAMLKWLLRLAYGMGAAAS